MGKKTAQTQQTVTIPQDVLARYNSVNQSAEQAAQQPFQIYSQNPDAFVAPLNQTQQAGIANTNAAAGQAQPYYDAATAQLGQAQYAAQPYINQAAGGIQAGLGAGGSGLQSALQSLNAANQNASPLNQQAGGYYNSAYQGAQPYNAAAGQLFAQGLGGANPLNQQAAQGYSGAYAGAQPYQQAATGLAAASAGAVDPSQLNTQQYLSPYLDTVLGGTKGLLDQQNAQAMSALQGDQIKGGYFGGDRGGIGAANLAQQQQIANASIYSGILNQGYGQALSTAQQQQGVGLGAAQANRAALGSAAGQLAQIGQQGYAQGTGTAQAQQGLAQQLYSQGLGAGSAVQGLGQQVYGQGTGTGTAVQGLGQQVFGQGLATSQQQSAVAQQQFQQQLQAAQAQAALGQQQYGMGANTSEQLAGLGSGAQSAALSGAQAQLGAGQAQQQTSQAGLQALYNQFQQQQSYPFQVAQFLANIAEGTGSLSGSTTTTTQPGGFFSDERLKEDIREVGKTFDGQPIVTYKYKDEPNVVRMGLIAQNVEKKHPDAVGESHGFKTVDYGRATDRAAERGHFASGGTPLLPGLGQGDLAALLQAQASMYGPYGGGGLYGGESGGLPHGGTSYVPESKGAVSPLAVAGPIAAQPSPMEQIKDAVEMADTASEGLGKAKDWYTKRKEKPEKATGGALYGDGLDIPNEQPDRELMTPGDGPGKQKSGFSKTVDAAKTVAKVVAMFADGGGVHLTDETDPSTAEVMRRRAAAREANAALGNQWAAGAKRTGDDIKAADPLGRGIGETIAKLPAMLRRYDPARAIGDMIVGRDTNTTGDYNSNGRVSAPAAVSPIAQTQGLGSAQPITRRPPVVAPARAAPAGASVAPPASVPPTAGLSPAPAPQAPQAPQVAAPPPAPVAGLTPMEQPGKLSAPKDPSGNPISGYLNGLKEGKSPQWMSLLSGIAAMGTAPTIHPGVALAAGLGAGTQAYQKARTTEADLAQKAALTATEHEQPAVVRAQAAQENAMADMTKATTLAELNRIAAMSGFVVQEDPKGAFQFDGKRYAAVPKASLINKGALPQMTGPSSAIGNAGHDVAKNAVMTFQGLGEPAKASAQQEIGDVISQGGATQRTMPATREWIGALSTMKDGPLQPGAFSTWGRGAANTFNSTIDLLPMSPEQKAALKFDPEGLTASQIAAKMQNSVAQARAAGVEQHSLGALEKNLAATPHEGMSRDAALTLASQEMVNAQQAIDMANYYAGVDAEATQTSGMARSFLPEQASQAFWKDNPSAKYDTERGKLTEMAKQPQFTTWLKLIQSGDARKAEQTAKIIDSIYGPGMSRYLTGGQ